MTKPVDEPRAGTASTGGAHLGINEPAGDDRLDTWKEIAGFIGRDERTAMRWAKEQGMPVHRDTGGKRSRVYALRSEISRWRLEGTPTEIRSETKIVEAMPEPPVRKPKLVLIAGLAISSLVLLAAISFALRFSFKREEVPARINLAGNTVTAPDAQGNQLWNYRFSRPLFMSLLDFRPISDLVRIADFRGGGKQEVLVVAAFRGGPNLDDTPDLEIDLFSATGKLLWSHSSNDTFRFGDHELRAPWYPRDVLVSENDGKRIIWIALTHHTWGNTYIANLNPLTGQETLRYMNTGSIRSLREVRTGQGVFLAVGGFNNEHDGPNLAFIDERKPFAASPLTSGTRHKCESCPAGEPDFYFVLPRSELNRIEGVYEDSIRSIEFEDEDFTALGSELGQERGNVRTLWRFQNKPNFQPISVRYSSTYDTMHRDLERSHKLEHTLENCPERLRPLPIRMWTPSAGWTEIHLKPRSFAQ